MSEPQTTRQGGSRSSRAARPPNSPSAAGTAGQPATSSDALQQRKYRSLITKHLGGLLDRLFAEFTGVHFHIAWSPVPPKTWDANALPTGCSVCCRLSRSPLLPECRTCGPKLLAWTLGGDRTGHCFTCRLGVRNGWFPIRIRGETLGVAYLQALAGRQPAGKRTSRLEIMRDAREATVLSRAEFARAARFLQLIVEHVQTASLADLRKADLTSAGHALLALEKEQTRLHASLERHLPPPLQASRRATPASHPDQLVQRLLAFIEQDYGQPLTLRHCAGQLGMNAAYLSDLFSQAVGVPFKTHLTARRMEKARELLGDPSRNVSEVAAAVGYASENRFRSAFKQATGLAPKVWRETMQVNPPPPVR
jgi:AraC-like DNA-binding protein